MKLSFMAWHIHEVIFFSYKKKKKGSDFLLNKKKYRQCHNVDTKLHGIGPHPQEKIL